MNDDTPAPTPETVSASRKPSPTLALILAFTPSVLLLAIAAVGRYLASPTAILMIGCLVSIVCCFVSAVMLFRRRGLAILFGILFLLLNGVISFFFGCAAVFSDIKF